MKKTFRSIDESKGLIWQVEPNLSTLELWHMSILDKQITDLEIGDLCRAVRQNLYTAELLPVVVSELDKDVLTGFLDDAELLKATSELSGRVWEHDLVQARKMLSILQRDEKLIAEEPPAVEWARILVEKLKAAVEPH
ncbi:contact-dependent growth inhibition system immunity protein [Pseudomonas marginalis]|jgi:hypothetical protein|uniref:contact-dependent growth inhibition system immunity protein n=1 Tax=Pseudomonas marginalis TaxID=298 RepID=UPI00247FB46B|nr:contact-dependent growth inhibition system immunity protein [Pseudomonas marginalis]WGT27061.1 contact-dependent growth inhibition system immunity protein [Pseudomonas marginalis]